MKALKIVMLALCVCAVTAIDAQKGQARMNIQYSYALPVGSFKTDVINNSSPRGATADILYNLSDKFSVGLGLGFQDFYQKYPRALYNTGEKEVTSAVLSNSVQVIPVLAKAEFYPLYGTKSFIQPYINAGAGLGITSFTQYLGEFGGTGNSGGFMLTGGAGVAIPFNKTGHAGARLGANYNMISYNHSGISNFNNVSFGAGIFFPLK